jgi:sarcosine oxidase gamma subunit
VNVAPGTYTVTESAPPAGWQFTSLSCSAGGSNAGQVATINLAAGASVTCTYTNTKQGTITIIKNTVGGNGTFAFTHNVGTASDPDVTSPFNIITAAGTGQQQFLNVSPGTYTVTESAPPAGWSFVSLSCSAGGSNAGQVATINLAAGASVTCTYTNANSGTITIVKNTVGGNGTFAFTHNVGTASDPDVASPFNIITAAGTGQQQFLQVPAGTYTVTESGPPAGWQFTSLSCSAGGSNAGQVATIILPAGGSVTCTYTNTKQGTITIIKNTVGGNGTFAFTHNVGTASDPDVTSPFNINTVANTGQQQFLNVSPGTYTVTESGPPAGWTFSSLSCSAGGSNAGQVATIILPAGGSVTCTYTNNAQGTITIIKNTVGGNGTFAFTHNVGTNSNPTVVTPFNINTAAGTGQQQFLQVNTGTYTVTESGPPAGWQFTSLSCSAGGSNAGQVATIVMTPGASITCTFTNTKLGTITINKNTVGGNGTFAFTHTVGTASDPDVASPFNIITASGTGQQQFLNTPAGTYTVTESGPPAGWVFTSLSCSAGGSNAGQVATIILPAGGSVTCTYTNTKLGSITIRKVVLGTGSTFEYTATSGASSTPLTTPFTIVVGDNGSNTQVFSNRVAGTYTVTEGPEADYTLTDLACSNAAGVGVVGTRTATINLPAGLDITCTFTNQFNSQTTRTQGFWSTHMELTQAVWFGGSSGGNDFTGVVDKTLCGVAIDDIGKLLGGFWANIAQTTTKAKRSDLDQAKMRLLQQLLAAILNNAAFGSNPTGAISIADAKDAFCSGTLAEVNAAASAMAAFNEGGDSGDFTPGGSANGKQAKDAANIAFWNVLPFTP